MRPEQARRTSSCTSAPPRRELKRAPHARIWQLASGREREVWHGAGARNALVAAVGDSIMRALLLELSARASQRVRSHGADRESRCVVASRSSTHTPRMTRVLDLRSGRRFRSYLSLALVVCGCAPDWKQQTDRARAQPEDAGLTVEDVPDAATEPNAPSMDAQADAPGEGTRDARPSALDAASPQIEDAALPLPSGSYAKTCGSCTSSPARLACGWCQGGPDGMLRDASLALPCDAPDIGNCNGWLTCGGCPNPPPGAYALSCERCILGGTTLSCFCPGPGGKSATSIDSRCPFEIENCEGSLTCGACGASAGASIPEGDAGLP